MDCQPIKTQRQGGHCNVATQSGQSGGGRMGSGKMEGRRSAGQSGGGPPLQLPDVLSYSGVQYNPAYVI